MSIRKPAIYLSISGLLIVSSACGAKRKPRLDGAVEPVGADSGSADASVCPLGTTEAGMCQGATMLDVDFCERAWVEVTPEPGVFGQDIYVRARARDIERHGLEVEWTSEPDGRFADYGSSSTTFHCESLGRKTLHMVSADVRGCASDVTVEINCVPPPAR